MQMSKVDFEKRLRTLGDNVSIMMEEKGLRKIDIARRGKIAPGVVTGIFQGERTPALRDLLSLCTILETTPNDLLGFNEVE